MTYYYQKDDSKLVDAIVIRINISDIVGAEQREKEFLTAQVAQAAGCFPVIYASFNNGIVYHYAPGRNPTFHDVIKPGFIQEFTRKLYAFHHADPDALKLQSLIGSPAVYNKTCLSLEDMGMVSSIPDKPDVSMGSERMEKFWKFRNEFTNDVLMKEFSFVKCILDDVSLPLSVTHLDLHLHNMLLDDDTGNITFIDFESGDYNFEYMDLAAFFLMRPVFEKIGYADPEEPSFTEHHRTLYLQGYLRAKYEKIGKSVDIIPAEEFELMDLQHKILETAFHLQAISTCLVLGCGIANDKFDFFDVIPATKENYYSGKQKLYAWRDRCKELVHSLSMTEQGLSQWEKRLHIWCLLSFAETLPSGPSGLLLFSVTV